MPLTSPLDAAKTIAEVTGHNFAEPFPAVIEIENRTPYDMSLADFYAPDGGGTPGYYQWGQANEKSEASHIDTPDKTIYSDLSAKKKDQDRSLEVFGAHATGFEGLSGCVVYEFNGTNAYMGLGWFASNDKGPFASCFFAGGTVMSGRSLWSVGHYNFRNQLVGIYPFTNVCVREIGPFKSRTFFKNKWQNGVFDVNSAGRVNGSFLHAEMVVGRTKGNFELKCTVSTK